jgi:hypothetical protein
LPFISNNPSQPIRTREEPLQKKWLKIFDAFFNNEIDLLAALSKSGTRGRIFNELFTRLLKAESYKFTAEPVFTHQEPNRWHEFYLNSNGLKLKIFDEYNPDYLLSDDDWVEVTLSENTAFKKILTYGHQAPKLEVFWLDEDTGHHKNVLENAGVPNASVRRINYLYGTLEKSEEGNKLIEQFELLKKLKGKLR